MTPFSLLEPGVLVASVLLAIRLSALLLIAPVFSAAVVPMRLRVALLLLLTMVFQPLAVAHAGSVALTPGSVASEVLTGFALGLGAAIFVGAAELAGEIATIQMGLNGAAVLDPMSRISVPVLGQFMNLFVVTLLLASDAHLVILDALAVSLERFPLGGATSAASGISAMLALGATLFSLGIRLAAPVMAAVLVGNVALAVLSRAAPQLNVLSVAFPLQIGLGLFTLGASLPMIASHFAGWSRSYDVVLDQLMPALAAGTR